MWIENLTFKQLISILHAKYYCISRASWKILSNLIRDISKKAKKESKRIKVPSNMLEVIANPDGLFDYYFT